MDIEAATQSAIVHLRKGKPEDAAKVCRAILEIQPSNFVALHLLGITYYRRKEYRGAIEHIKEALRLQPAYAEAYNTLGIVYHEVGELDPAVSCFHEALRLKPDFVEPYVNLGNTLEIKGLCDDALASFQKALQFNPALSEVSVNTARLLHSKGLIDEAAACLRSAIRYDPDCFGLYDSLGMVLKDMLNFDEAALCFQRAIQLNPVSVGSYISLGNVLQAKGSLEEATSCFHGALHLSPDNAYANYNLSLALLQSGNFEEGWKRYESRRQIEGLKYLQTDFARPMWDGTDMRGGTVLLLGEQGFGDVIQFIRYVPFVVRRNARVVVCCHRELVSLIQNVDGVQATVAYGDTLPEFDAYIHIMSLPFILLSITDDIPAAIPYLKVAPSAEEKWRGIIRSGSPGLKVGIVWSGNPKNIGLRYKSCSLIEFAPLARSGVTLFSLQKGEAADQTKSRPLGMQLTDYTGEIVDFSDTAALIKNLDLVISVDTAVAHLAGALGKPVWILLPYASDWRWMVNRDDSPWYPSMRLFRQKSPGDWASVMASVGRELEILAGSRERIWSA